jgi:Family of unknown function (DUF6186)
VTRTVTLAGYALIVVAMLATELRARRTGRATIADAVDVILRTRIGRLVILAAWLWIGWHVFVRRGPG